MSQMPGNEPEVISVFVVLPPHTLLLDVAGPLEVLRYANEQQQKIRFDCRYIAAQPNQTTTIGLGLCGLEPLPEVLPAQAMILISGSSSTSQQQPEVAHERRAISDCLRRTARPDTTIVSICSGALIAAEAGLFDGHHCTTHAHCIADLKRIAPLAFVEENRLFVEDGKRFSSAGISTGIDLTLHLVSTLVSPEVAARIAQIMVVYLRRTAQDPQISPWLSGRNHIHPSIHRAQDAIVADPAADWTLARLADIAHLSQRHLSRLFREQTGLSVVDYINLIRVTLARDIISQSRLDMEAVAERAGFASARHLRRIWQQHHTKPPTAFRNLSS
ncbi:transcriptional regulator GlxA family with amidase domain [Agrobacterium larrymoorei]|uniref:Transcriptional regulator GlxA family with amidase domain n=2 Tax=Agrobacterium larrymoorei TaxID=160699 RepID=A0AAJ2BCE2_9HYPH|nr:helix-turn-helix domain-containing protein [Agrobacterium larrymoorei]MDR6100354.1 transcriptional regulator GlxA family with amidase domain [Agrobacterium larrymoorei]